MIRIIGSEINLRHRALEVYVSGCIRDCPGCHNPEAQAFGNGMRWDKWLTANRYKLATGTFRNVWILGGDLLCQPEPAEVEEFLRSLRHIMPEEMDLWLWTGAYRKDVPSSVLRHIDWLKTGPRPSMTFPSRENSSMVWTSSCPTAAPPSRRASGRYGCTPASGHWSMLSWSPTSARKRNPSSNPQPARSYRV